MKIGIEERKSVLISALAMEGMTTAFLAELLGIKNVKKSKTLKQLSFNQKIHLLIDIGALKHSDYNKFQTFMEIRNQFMHNLEATSYEKCFSFIENGMTKVLKLYPQTPSLITEEKLKNAVNALSEELIQLTYQIIEKVKEKINKDIQLKSSKEMNDALFKSIEQLKVAIDNYIDNEMAKDKNFGATQLKGLGTKIDKMITQLLVKNLTSNK